MPKAKFFAVARGREGPRIYESWAECDKNVTRFPNAKHKSFPTRVQAQEFLDNNTIQGRPPARAPPPPDAEIIVIDSDSDSPPARRPVTRKSPSKRPAMPRDDSEDDTDMEIQIIGPPQVEEAQSNKIVLSDEQQNVLNRVVAGESIFFTGSAGTGKSILLREIIKALRETGRDIGVTASTGIASVNIDGCTLHSWAGIQLGDQPAKKYIGKLRGQSSSPASKRWKKTRTLIIDEISMIDGKLFDKLEQIGREVRNSDQPFGGIQLVLCGDFCQLPPVPDRDGTPVVFAFDAKTWGKCIKSSITLTRVFRQKEQIFIDMLNAMRFGELQAHAIRAFRDLDRPVVYEDGIGPTELFPLRSEVSEANASRLRNLKGPSHTYRARDLPGVDQYGRPTETKMVQKLLERLVVPEEITLKVGAQVMLVKNLEQGHLVNGSVGQVIDFLTAKDAVDGNHELGVGPRGDDAHNAPDPRAAVKGFPLEQKWPLVRFTNGRSLLCVPQDFTVDNANGEVEAKRDQCPLILAWALSMHKSQGQTLERVKVDLRSTFEKGQAYVALSRATSMQTLEVRNFSPTAVMAHPRVIEWSKGRVTHELMDDDMEAFFNE